MNIYKIEQDTNVKYDTYDSAVVIAESESKAKYIHPTKCKKYYRPMDWKYEWCKPSQVTVTYIGIADPSFTKPCVIVSSYNAG